MGFGLDDDAQIASQPGATCRHPATPYGRATRPQPRGQRAPAPATACVATAAQHRCRRLTWPQPLLAAGRAAAAAAAVRAPALISRLLGPAALVRTGAAPGEVPRASPRPRSSPKAGRARKEGGPKAGGGGARSACVARCPRPCVTAYLTWPSRLRARVQVRSGGPELALELEKDGYAFLDMDEKAFKDAE